MTRRFRKCNYTETTSNTVTKINAIKNILTLPSSSIQISTLNKSKNQAVPIGEQQVSVSAEERVIILCSAHRKITVCRLDSTQTLSRARAQPHHQLRRFLANRARLVIARVMPRPDDKRTSIKCTYITAPLV